MQGLIQETQKLKQKGKSTSLIWWIPSEFWEMALREDPSLTEDQKVEFVKALDDYTAFVVVKMDAGILGGMTFKSREDILKNISLMVGNQEIDPIPIKNLSPDASSFYTMMKPMMGQMLGQFGQGMEFIIYPNKKNGELIIDPTKKGSFTYISYGVNNDWRLPLGNLMPPVWDPASGEVFPGNYKFNPFTGAKLIVKKEEKK